MSQAPANPYKSPNTPSKEPELLQAMDKPWWHYLTSYHWFVFAMAALAWLFDCLDQQIFILFRDDALKALMPDRLDDVPKFGGYATSVFVAGWATGGLIFGSIGDRIGRAKTLTLTVLLYSLFTGLSAFSTGWADFFVYRFITGLGVGGVFGLAVALIADTLPDKARPGALGMLQALSAVGNITAGLIKILMAYLILHDVVAIQRAWTYAFLVGAVPAFLCVFIALRLREPEKWVKAREAGKISGAKFGSYTSLLGEARWSKPALLGMLLCVAGVIGLWGIGFFSPELVGSVVAKALSGTADAKELAFQKAYYQGVNGIIQNIGAFFGMVAFSMLTQRTSRKLAFVVAYVGALAATNLYFQMFNSMWDLWMVFIMGFFQLAIFAGFAIYLPELFPTRLRSTGTSFCYNVGRFLAASGPFTMGILQKSLGDAAVARLPETADAAAKAAAKLDAFRMAASWVSLVFIIGLVVIIFLPETKGKPLPEE
jgi:MFS family permease